MSGRENEKEQNAGWTSINKKKGRNASGRGGRNTGRGGNRSRADRSFDSRKAYKQVSSGIYGALVEKLCRRADSGEADNVDCASCRGMPCHDHIGQIVKAIFDDVQRPDKRTTRVSRTELEERRALRFEDQEGKIRLMVLNVLLMDLHRYSIIQNPEFDAEAYLRTEVAPLITFAAETDEKSPDGYAPVNVICWELWVEETFDQIDVETYVVKTIQIIEVLKEFGIKCESTNKESEDWFSSYLQAVKRKRAIKDKRIIAALTDGTLDTTRMIRNVINKIAPGMSLSLIRQFMYLCLMDLPGLCRGLIVNLLGSYQYGKKQGVHERVSDFLSMVLDFLVVKKREHKVKGNGGEIEMVLKHPFEAIDDTSDGMAIHFLKDEYNYSKEMVDGFLLEMVKQAGILLMEMPERCQTLVGSEWAWDVIGGLIGEIAVMVRNPRLFHKFITTQLEESVPGSTAENQVLTSIAHTIHRLKEIFTNAPVAERKMLIARFLNCQICDDLTQTKFSARTRMLLESQVSEYIADVPKGERRFPMVNIADFGHTLHLEEWDSYADVKRRVMDAVECSYASDGEFTYSSHTRECLGGDHPTFEGWRAPCQLLARGQTKDDWITRPAVDGREWKPIREYLESEGDMYRILSNIAHHAAGELSPDDAVRQKQVENLVIVLQTYIELAIIQRSLNAFNRDLSRMSKLTLLRMWDNPCGHQAFTEICRAFGVRSVFE